MKIVAIINHKGGVGKTTLTACVGQALALCGFRVLAVDNDSQHNLSTMLGSGVCSPGIRDIYTSPLREAPAVLFRSVRKTSVDGLHVITSPRDLSTQDVQDELFLRRCMAACDLGRYYDYVLIDNAPGIDRLQICAMHAADELFVPTELRQFAVDGIVEMERMLRENYPDAAPITKVVPNFYRNTKRQNSFLLALNRLFPGRVTRTVVPVDQVFDELITENKVLFLHRLFSRGAAYYLKLVHELFDLQEETVWENMIAKRRKRMSDEARERFYSRQAQSEEPHEQ